MTVTIFQPTITRLKNGVKTREKSKIWRMKWKDPSTGKVCTETTKARDKYVARQIAREKEKSLLLNPLGIKTTAKGRIRLATLAEEYLESCKGRNKESTRDNDKKSLKNIERVIGNVYLDEVTTYTLQALIVERLQIVKPHTVNKDLRVLRAAMNWGREQYQIPEIVFKKLMVRTDIKNPVYLAPELRERILVAVDKADLKVRSADWWRLFITVLDQLGLRRSEALNLRWKWLNESKRTISVQSEDSKGRRDRELPLDQELLGSLLAWKEQGTGQLVFPWEGGIRKFYDDWEQIVTLAGCPDVVPQHFRSTCGSELVAAGVPTADVKRFLGHSTVVTTEKYYLSASQSLAGALEKRRAFGAPASGDSDRLAELEAQNRQLVALLAKLSDS